MKTNSANSNNTFRISFTSFLFIAVMLLLLLLSTIFIIFRLNAIEKHVVPPQLTEKKTQTETLQREFVTRTFEIDPQDSEFADTVYSIPESDLIKLSCAGSYFVYHEDKYWWRPQLDHHLYDEIEDDSIVEAIEEVNKQITDGRKVLSGTVCETEYGNVILSYLVSDVSEKGSMGYHDGVNVDAYVTVLGEGNSYHEGIFIQHEDYWPVAVCRQPLQMTKAGELYVVCNRTISTEAVATLHKINLTNGDVTQEVQCTYTRPLGGGIDKSCN